MNDTVYIGSKMTDDERRQGLYKGQLFVHLRCEAAAGFAQFARELIEEAFAPLDPRLAQHDLPVERYAEILGQLKPQFIHHPESKRHLQSVFLELGRDLRATYFEVPRLRTSTSDGYLTSGIAYAWHPHRDTWYSAPACQINWWLPVYDFKSENAMAFHPTYWGRTVGNTSCDYNYYVWNKVHRGREVAGLLREDPRPLPRALEPIDSDPQLRIVCPVGGSSYSPLRRCIRACRISRGRRVSVSTFGPSIFGMPWSGRGRQLRTRHAAVRLCAII